jgi:hypothetical protein
VVTASSTQSTGNTTKLFAAIQGQQNSTDKLQEAVFRSLHVQVPTISEINKISITQQQQKQRVNPQELQNGLKIFLDNLSPKQKSMLTQPQKNLLGIMPTIIQKGLSPHQGTQVTSFLTQYTKGAVSGTANLGIKLISLAESGKLRFPDVLMGIAAIYLSSHTGLSPDVLYEGGKYLLAQLPSPVRPTTQVSSTINPQKQPHPITTTDFSPPASVQDNKNKRDLVVVPIKDCYDDTGKNSYCVKIDPKHNVGLCNDDDIDCVGDDYILPSKDATGKWYYPPNALEKAQKDAANKAAIDAGKDAKGSNGHGYDSSCPSGHSAGFCGSYKQAYDNVWKDLHSSNNLIPTPDKSFQNGVQQQ